MSWNLLITSLLALCILGHTLDVRLVGGQTSTSGNVEIREQGGEWSGVCDNSWKVEAATVVCRQLGFGSPNNVTTGSHFGQTSNGEFFSYVECVGNELAIDNCDFPSSGIVQCPSNLAGVSCDSGTENTTPRVKPHHECDSGEIFHGVCKGPFIGMMMFLTGACLLITSLAVVFFRYRMLPTRLWDPWIIARMRNDDEELIERSKGSVRYIRRTKDGDAGLKSFSDVYPRQVYESYDNPPPPQQPEPLPAHVVERIMAQMALHSVPVPSPSSDIPDISKKFTQTPSCSASGSSADDEEQHTEGDAEHPRDEREK